MDESVQHVEFYSQSRDFCTQNSNGQKCYSVINRVDKKIHGHSKALALAEGMPQNHCCVNLLVSPL